MTDNKRMQRVRWFAQLCGVAIDRFDRAAALLLEQGGARLVAGMRKRDAAACAVLAAV